MAGDFDSPLLGLDGSAAGEYEVLSRTRLVSAGTERGAKPRAAILSAVRAASQVADVFLNGKLLGEHRGGFGAFCFEVTGRLAPTGANLLAVRVSNEMFPDVAPLDGDFNVYGGVYRPVHLIETAAQCFTPLDHALPGVVWQQTSVSAQHAVLDVTAEISNGTDDGRPFTLFPDGFVTSNDPDGQKSPKGNFTLVATVFDTAGHTVADVGQPIVLSQINRAVSIAPHSGKPPFVGWQARSVSLPCNH